MLHPRTLATLEELRAADWFAAVGQPVEGPYVNLSSWAEAVERCSADEWEGLQLEAANRYCERLAERSRERFNKWNEIVDEVKAAIVPLVKEKVGPVVSAHGLPAAFEHSVRWDMIHLGMEAEYADVFPPGFFAGQGYWYVRGHFPCGWEGEFPQGKLVLF